MRKQNFFKILWIAALILGILGILGHYDLVVIKGLNKYNFEMIFSGYVILLILRIMKK